MIIHKHNHRIEIRCPEDCPGRDRLYERGTHEHHYVNNYTWPVHHLGTNDDGWTTVRL